MLTAQRWIVFDFDGTLVDTLPLTMEFINKYCIAKFECDPIETEEFRSNTISNVIIGHIGWLNLISSPLLLSHLVSQCTTFFEENKDKITFFPGAEKLLELLASKYSLAIITSGETKIVAQTLEKYRLSPVIKDVYSDRFSLFSGKEVTIEKFLEIHQLSPDEVVYVGDDTDDVSACRKTGVKIISVTWGYNTRDFLEQAEPDYLVDSFDDLELTIDSLVNA
jgi:phosphoglycolate phosphatase